MQLLVQIQSQVRNLKLDFTETISTAINIFIKSNYSLSLSKWNIYFQSRRFAFPEDTTDPNGHDSVSSRVSSFSRILNGRDIYYIILYISFERFAFERKVFN